MEFDGRLPLAATATQISVGTGRDPARSEWPDPDHTPGNCPGCSSGELARRATVANTDRDCSCGVGSDDDDIVVSLYVLGAVVSARWTQLGGVDTERRPASADEFASESALVP